MAVGATEIDIYFKSILFFLTTSDLTFQDWFKILIKKKAQKKVFKSIDCEQIEIKSKLFLLLYLIGLKLFYCPISKSYKCDWKIKIVYKFCWIVTENNKRSLASKDIF